RRRRRRNEHCRCEQRRPRPCPMEGRPSAQWNRSRRAPVGCRRGERSKLGAGVTASIPSFYRGYLHTLATKETCVGEGGSARIEAGFWKVLEGRFGCQARIGRRCEPVIAICKPGDAHELGGRVRAGLRLKGLAPALRRSQRRLERGRPHPGSLR